MRNELVIGLLLAACSGGGGSHTPDAASVGDGAPDAPPDANESARVTVTAYTFDLDGAIDPSAIAIFYDPSGAVIQHGPVDAQGQASASMPTGGSVTVLQPKPDPANVYYKYDRITTIRSVEPGDNLITGRTDKTVTRTGTYDQMQASYTSINNAAGPYWLTKCASPGLGPSPVQLTFYASCATPTFDLLVLADDQTTSVRKYVWMDDVPHVPNGALTIPNTWQALSTNTTTLLNTPANMLVNASLYTVIDGVPMTLDGKSQTAPPPTSSVSIMYAPTTAPMQAVAAFGQGFVTFERYVIVTNSPTATTSIDWATLPVPRATNVMQSSESVLWSQAAPDSGDARVITWAAQWTDGNNITHIGYEEILEPAQGAHSSKLPTLPSEYADEDPMVHVAALRSASVWYLEYDNLPDYHAAKPLGVELFRAESEMVTTPHRAHVSFGGTN